MLPLVVRLHALYVARVIGFLRSLLRRGGWHILVRDVMLSQLLEQIHIIEFIELLRFAGILRRFRIGLGVWASDDARALDGGVGCSDEELPSDDEAWHRRGSGPVELVVCSIFTVSVFSSGGIRGGSFSTLDLAARTWSWCSLSDRRWHRSRSRSVSRCFLLFLSRSRCSFSR